MSEVGGPRPREERGRTAAGRVARQVAARFREGRAALETDVWKAWRRTIAIGAAGMLVLMLVLRYTAEWALDNGWLDWERDFLLRLGSDGPAFSAAVFLQTFGSDITLVILIGLTAGIAAWARRPIVALSIILAAIVPDLVGRFGWAIWDRARPDLLYDGIASPGFHAFPSGHSSKTMAVYGMLAVLWFRASSHPAEKVIAILVTAAIAVLVPVGRMAMGVHWPSDVIGGLIIGGVWLGILTFALKRAGSVRDSGPQAGRSASR